MSRRPRFHVKEYVYPLADDDEGFGTPSGIVVPPIQIEWVQTDDMPAWVFDDEVAYDRLSLEERGDLTAKGWLTLYRYTSSRTRHPGTDRMGGAPSRLNDFHFLTMIDVDVDDSAERFARRTGRAWTDFHDEWMMWGDLTDGPFVYEADLRKT